MQCIHFPTSQTSRSQCCVTMTLDDDVKVGNIRVIDELLMNGTRDVVSGLLLVFVVVVVVATAAVVVVVVVVVVVLRRV